METPPASPSGDAAPAPSPSPGSSPTSGWTAPASPAPAAAPTPGPGAPAAPAAPAAPPAPDLPDPMEEARRRQVRSRMKGIGFAIIALSSLIFAYHVITIVNWEKDLLAYGPAADGGPFTVQVVPPEANWTVRLVTLDGDRHEFARLVTDANGTARFGAIQDAVFRLEASRENRTISGYALAPPNRNTDLTLDTNAPQGEWIGGTPGLQGMDWVIVGLYAALFAIAIAGGASLVQGRRPRLASGGAGAATAIGFLSFSIAFLPAVGLIGVGIWGLFTVRRNPDQFTR